MNKFNQLTLERLNSQFEQAHPQEILAWTVETYATQAVVVTSFQPTGIVTLHMLQSIDSTIPVITLDTALLFTNTYQLMDTIAARFDIEIQRIRPALTLDAQAAQYGEQLWERNPDLCCQLRKVHPLQAALQPYDAWLTGLRRDQSSKRAHTPILAWDDQHEMLKICPFATWTETMIWDYVHQYDLPYNALHDNGYPSIGCFPCTSAPINGGGTRSGRWQGTIKTECGIHFDNLAEE